MAKEVARQQRLQARAAESTTREVLAAVHQVKALRDDLEAITARLEEPATARGQPVARPAEGRHADRPDVVVEPADIPDWEP